MLLDEVTARRYDREEAAINFTYAYRQAGQWQYFVVTAMTREQADDVFKTKFPGIIDYKVKLLLLLKSGRAVSMRLNQQLSGSTLSTAVSTLRL
ncbi:hypothetical protein NO386_25860 [Escherichia coli]|nr:hypothetical protein [Escherichia coli]